MNFHVFNYAGRMVREWTLRLALTVFAAACVGLLEGFGIALLLPLLEMIQSGGPEGTNTSFIGEILVKVFETIGLPLELPYVLTFIFGIILMQQVAYLVQQKLIYGSTYSYEAFVRKELYSTMLKAEWQFFMRHKTASINNALTFETKRASEAFFQLNVLLALFIVVSVYFALAVSISWQMTFLTIFVGAATFLTLNKYVSKAVKFGQEITSYNEDMQNETIEQVSNMKLIKGCSIEQRSLARFGNTVDRLANAQYRSGINQAWMKALFDPVSAMMLLLGLYLAVTVFMMSIPQIVVFMFVFYRLSPRISNLQNYQQTLLSLLPGLKYVDELKKSAGSATERRGGTPFGGLKNALTFNSVDFSYNGSKEVLHDVSIKVEKGQKIAIVGSSGAGKSTLIDLLMGLLEPSAGTIEVDATDLKMLDLASWRSKIGYVAQDSVLFHASIRQNLLWANENATEADIERALKLANAEEFVRDTEHGIETMIGERGKKLSGGQRQRLALARALVRHPEILVLDEATSALDSESEKFIQEAIESLSNELTVIIVTHRYSTIRNVDHIFLLEDGAVVEHGTWSELTEAKGRFNAFRNLQEI